MAAQAKNSFQRYGLTWSAEYDPLQVEMKMIQRGGQWRHKDGKLVGNGLFFHYKEMQKVLWPEDDHHRWSDLCLEAFAREEITVMMGAADSSKTFGMAKFALCDYWCFPDDTLWMISSTEYRGAELRVWGSIKRLFNAGRKRFGYLAGNVLESLHSIATDSIDDEGSARSIQRGMVLVPCKKGGSFVGLGAFVGIKSPRLRHAGDECQHMEAGFLDAYSNWYGKADFKGIMAGNPLDVMDPLCVAGEPPTGWDNFEDNGKTQTWRSKFFNAFVIALDGRDSPNNDFEGDKPKYPYIVGKKKLDAVRKTYGEDSWQWWNQCVGKPNKNMAVMRVLTPSVCEEHHAHDDARWENESHTWIYAVDPAYGGGDRCIGGPMEFGMGLDGKQILKVYPYELIPVKLSSKEEPESQIANYVKTRLEDLGIPVENCGYDSFGKGTLGFWFAKVFGANTPVPIDSGAQPTDRPVRYDLFVTDTATGTQRLMRCDEYYSKFVTEMWFSVRETVQGDQLRELPKDVRDELCMRIYRVVKGNRIEVEPKADMKERLRHSPDLGDWCALGVEMARRKGFKILRIGVPPTADVTDNWLTQEAEEYRDLIKSKLLQHA